MRVIPFGFFFSTRLSHKTPTTVIDRNGATALANQFTASVNQSRIPNWGRLAEEGQWLAPRQLFIRLSRERQVGHEIKISTQT